MLVIVRKGEGVGDTALLHTHRWRAGLSFCPALLPEGVRAGAHAHTVLHSTHRHCSLPISAAPLLPQAENDFGLSCGLWPLKGWSL